MIGIIFVLLTIFSQTEVIDALDNYDFTNLNCDCTPLHEAENSQIETDDETEDEKIALKCLCGANNETRRRISLSEFANLPFEEKTKSLTIDDITIGDRVFSPRNWVYQGLNLGKFNVMVY